MTLCGSFTDYHIAGGKKSNMRASILTVFQTFPALRGDDDDDEPAIPASMVDHPNEV